jgi:hypothetical protein
MASVRSAMASFAYTFFPLPRCAMLDLLFALLQFSCVLGLLYWVILVVAHGDCADVMGRYYDPIAGHDWLGLREAGDESASRASIAVARQTQRLPRIPQVSLLRV